VAIVRHYLLDPAYIHFDTITECDRHTDTWRQHLPHWHSITQ